MTNISIEAAKSAISDIIDSYNLAIDENIENKELASSIKESAQWDIIGRAFNSFMESGTSLSLFDGESDEPV